LTALSKELMAAIGTAGEALFSSELRRGIARGTDHVFLAGIVSTGTPDDTAATFAEAIGKVLAGLATRSTSRVYLIMSPTVAKYGAGLASASGGMLFPHLGPTGGTIGVIPALVSDELAQDEILAVDADQIAANAGSVEFDTSGNADLSMVTDPAMPASLISMFASNSLALRSVREFGFSLLAVDAASRCTISALSES
jgi:hypothetical protein